jgi:hypothetical protein
MYNKERDNEDMEDMEEGSNKVPSGAKPGATVEVVVAIIADTQLLGVLPHSTAPR